MKAKIYRKLAWEKLNKLIPKRFHGKEILIPQDKDIFSAIIFPFDDKHVVLSSDVEKALKKLSIYEDEHIVFLASNVTLEASAAIEARSATLLRLRDFFWTDEGFLKTRNR